MSTRVLTSIEISTYSSLKSAMALYRSQGYTKVIFPELSGEGALYGVLNYVIPVPQPNESPFIQLPPQVDFNHWTIKVVNANSSAVPLFSIEKWSNERITDFNLTKVDVDRGDYMMCPELSNGKRLLVLTDQKEWAYQTFGNSGEPVIRHDLIALNDGVPENSPIAPWNTPSTAMSYYYYEANDIPIVIENLTFKRTRYPGINGIVKFIRVDGKYDVTFRNISMEFIESSGDITKNGDLCFEIYNSAHVKFENITVNGTYSAENAYGYAFYLDNVYDSSFRNVIATGLWGVFGSRNINQIHLENCTLNHLGISCYGKDVYCRECTFENTLSSFNYNQFSSIFGTLQYESCIFKSFLPALFVNAYHTYTGFEFVMISCILDGYHSEQAFINAGKVENPQEKRRPELRKIDWPNVSITGLKPINIPSGTIIDIFKLDEAPVNPAVNKIDYISQATVSYGIWTAEDKVKYPSVIVGSSAASSNLTFRLSNYINSLVFINTIIL